MRLNLNLRPAAAAAILIVLTALTSCTSKMQQYVDAANDECPVNFVTGILTSVELNDKAVVFNIEVNEKELTTIENLKKNPNMLKQMWKMLFIEEKETPSKKDFLNLIASQGMGVRLNYMSIDNHAKNFSINIGNSEFKSMLKNPVTIDEQIQTQVDFSKVSLPQQLDSATTMVDTKIEDGFIVYIYDIDEQRLTMSEMESKQHVYRDNISTLINNVFTDPSSPVGDFFRMIGKKGWGIRYSYKGNASGKVLNIDFTNDQLKQMETSNNFTGNP